MDNFLECGSIMSCGPGKVLIGYGKRTWLPARTRQQKPHFYFPYFFLNKANPWFTHEHIVEMDFEAFSNQLGTNQQDNRPLVWTNQYKHLFQQTFHELKEKFTAGKLIKAVPFVFDRTSSSMTATMLKRSLKNLLHVAKTYSLHLYGFWENGEGILGATPEVLFTLEKKGSILHTMACAGTRKGDNLTHDLLNDPKELREHRIVVDDIVTALALLGKVTVEKVRLAQFPGLAHLITPIQAHIQKGHSFETIVRALHPTPALGAYPRLEGMAWLKNFQSCIDRKRFGAPAGYWSPISEEARCFVAIRNVQWDESGMSIGAGCGVIAESVLENEWTEIRTKMKAVKTILAMEGENDNNS